MTTTKTLPDFIQPMLAESGSPFDSDEHLFEIKWDGIRAMAYIERGSYRIMTRRRFDATQRYPEFGCLGQLPAGTILDGEIVVLDQAGKPDFRAVLTREQARAPLRYQTLARSNPAHFVVFDQLYHDFESLLPQPLSRRREHLLQMAGCCDTDRLTVSDGVIGAGKAFFQQAIDRDLEGVMAKRLSSRYFPGRRSDAWIKIRKSSTILCAIIGYVPKGADFESLIIAAEDAGQLRCVGRVGTGFNTPLRDTLNELLRRHECDKPLIACNEKGRWLEAGLYCSVRYLEMTRDGRLREPVFERLITD